MPVSSERSGTAFAHCLRPPPQQLDNQRKVPFGQFRALNKETYLHCAPAPRTPTSPEKLLHVGRAPCSSPDVGFAQWLKRSNTWRAVPTLPAYDL
mmetsp:Transcript_127308/g.220316  ORF Transcript_127308/g.220316 Transcript_127308/m.220316 type:complete len:95 (-) Transcript_127308:2418-2702(-)